HLIDPSLAALHTLSLHDALPISFLEPITGEHFDEEGRVVASQERVVEAGRAGHIARDGDVEPAQRRDDRGHRRSRVPDALQAVTDRKSTRLNSSHVAISYAVFCL